MKTYLYWLVVLLFSVIIAGCSNAAELSTAQTDKITALTKTPTHTPTAARDTSWSLTATLQALPQDGISTALAYYNYNNIDPTQTPIPVVTPVLPTLTSFPVNFESLPKLNDVIISSLDLEKIRATPEELSDDFLVYLLDTNSLVEVVNAKYELRDCLLDCAKYRYSLKDGLLTTILLRTGNKQKAENTVENLKKDFLKLQTDNSNWWVTDDTDLLPEIAPQGVPSNAWLIVVEKSEHLPPLPESQLMYDGQGPPVLVTQVIATGVAHGSIVVLITYHKTIYIEEGWAADIGTSEAIDYPLHLLKVQIQKLEASGYLK